jgi:prolipoprotein diacylglyceryltransferase
MKYKNRIAQIGCILTLFAMWYGFISLIINIWNTSLFTVGGILSIFFVIGMSILLCVMSIILFAIMVAIGEWK